MQVQRSSLFSAFGVPLLGLGALLFSLGHAGPTPTPRLEDASAVYLVEPDSRMDRSFAIYLRQQAKQVTACRARLRQSATADRNSFGDGWRRDELAQAIGDYNLVAQECTPAVFAVTHLPPSLEP